MQKTVRFYSLVVVAAIVFLPGLFTSDASAPAPGLKYPKKVDAVIQDKCFGCHNQNGKNEKAKQKLMWDQLLTLPANEQAATLGEIQETLEKGSMPPARFLENNPDKKLTDAEAALMKKWAAKAVKKASK